MDVVRKLIEDRMRDLSLNRVQVSRMLNRNQTYMQDFLVKGSPRFLPERERHLLADILKVPENELRGPSATLPRRNYEKTATNLLATDSRHSYGGVVESKILADQGLISSAVDLPVYSTGPGGDNAGGLVLLDKIVDWVARPLMLARVQDAYAVIVQRTVMEPVIRAGTVMLFHPHQPPRPGDVCMWRAIRDGVTYVQGAEYRGETADSWKLRQYNPARDFTLKKADWPVCHRGVGAYFP